MRVREDANGWNAAWRALSESLRASMFCSTCSREAQVVIAALSGLWSETQARELARLTSWLSDALSDTDDATRAARRIVVPTLGSAQMFYSACAEGAVTARTRGLIRECERRADAARSLYQAADLAASDPASVGLAPGGPAACWAPIAPPQPRATHRASVAMVALHPFDHLAPLSHAETAAVVDAAREEIGRRFALDVVGTDEMRTIMQRVTAQRSVCEAHFEVPALDTV